VPETSRIERMEDKMASLEVATAHGFGEVRQDIAHVRQLVEATLDRPPAPPPIWVLLLSSGTFLVGMASLILSVSQLVK